MPLAEAPEVERRDPQAERFEMRANFAGAVGFAGMPEHVNQGVQLPPIGITESGAQAARIEAGKQFNSVAEFGELTSFARPDRRIQ